MSNSDLTKNKSSKIERNIIIVKLEDNLDNYKLVLNVNDNDEITSKSFPKKDLQDIKEKFISTRTKIKKLIKNAYRIENFNILSHVIEEISDCSSYFVNNIFEEKDSREIHKQILELIKNKIDNLLYKENPVGEIVYEGNISEFIPLEYLFIRNREIRNSLNNLSNSILSLSQILGFSFIIYRNLRKTNGIEDIPGEFIPFEEKLDIEIYTCNKKYLKNVKDEIEFFKNHNKNYFDAKLKYPWKYNQNAEEKLVKKLIKNNPQFHHFCCHCDTSSKYGFDHNLDFGRKKIYLEKLQKHYFQRQREGKNRRKLNKTILFLNACGSAVVNPSAMITFPKVFLENFGHMGFIGSEYPIGDSFACDFARVFYSNLLRFGHLGLALFRTRWFFAKKYSNPLGLFYTLYADPFIRLSKIVDSVQF